MNVIGAEAEAVERLLAAFAALPIAQRRILWHWAAEIDARSTPELLDAASALRSLHRSDPC